MYKSPIELIVADATETLAERAARNLDEAIIRAVHQCGVAVDNEELVRTLNYDREQYQQGYEDGVRDMMEAQRWIPVTERLPTKDDANRLKNVIAIFKREDFARCWHYETIIRHPTQFTHWMPLPRPPKDGGT